MGVVESIDAVTFILSLLSAEFDCPLLQIIGIMLISSQGFEIQKRVQSTYRKPVNLCSSDIRFSWRRHPTVKTTSGLLVQAENREKLAR